MVGCVGWVGESLGEKKKCWSDNAEIAGDEQHKSPGAFGLFAPIRT